ncbi:Pyocin activator protein PrtN [compost metagenome]
MREEYLPHIGSMDHLLDEIRIGRIQLRYTRLHASRKAQPVVYLRDLATWLDNEDPYHQPSTTQATASDKAA